MRAGMTLWVRLFEFEYEFELRGRRTVGDWHSEVILLLEVLARELIGSSCLLIATCWY